MFGKIHKLISIRGCLILFVMLLFFGCMAKEQGKPGFSGPPIGSGKIVFLGFKAAIAEGNDSGMFHNPITGAMVRSEPVSNFVTDSMSDKMYALLIQSKDYEIINLHNVKSITDPARYKEDKNNEIKIIQDIGKTVAADVAITGYIYRMREREGTEYSVKRPASAAFDIYLISIKDGSILWKGNFDQTQRSLSENVLELKSFLKFKGKWVDVDKLAGMGLEKLVNEMPLKNKK